MFARFRAGAPYLVTRLEEVGKKWRFASFLGPFIEP
jgi:hypothetical protein